MGGKINQLTSFLAFFVVAKVEFEFVVLGLLVELDDHLGGEGPTGLGAEAVQRADLALAKKLLDLGQLEGAPGG